MHAENSFLTLTYDPEHVPKDGQLKPDDFTNFHLKLERKTGKKIRYLQVGEYGEQGSRPHHHVLLFGHDFSDKKLFSKRENQLTYVSEHLTQIWEKGFTTVQDLNYGTARYACRYSLKKVGAKKKIGYQAEYATMSRNPGIGSTWYDKYKSDVYPQDKVRIFGGGEAPPPRYYDEKYAKENPREFARIKEKRLEASQKQLVYVNGKPMLLDDNDSFRRNTKEYCAMTRIGQLKRNYEEI